MASGPHEHDAGGAADDGRLAESLTQQHASGCGELLPLSSSGLEGLPFPMREHKQA